ncbi:hypothetical protein PN36_23425 [Candidatus Thiomargarita nelsonii]|uniref:DUF4435 domain-containing protein n=1 Tax=Candidatus Thiomargarita nelsonii TaxID=1003181 RepID=A0A4E0RQB4_9GAMM|nr:hypothetical protein PN36_23425 [Candidatus Thiomargarita nelsonii]
MDEPEISLHIDWQEQLIKIIIYLARGKEEVLKIQAGEYLLLCVDSDYDYLLQDATEVSKRINQEPYIFQTYAYSIENYKCYAESLRGVCVSVIYDNVVLMFLKPLDKLLKDEKIQEFKASNSDETVLTNKIKQYHEQKTPIEDVLKLNTNYYSCFLMKKIERDVEIYLASMEFNG